MNRIALFFITLVAFGGVALAQPAPAPRISHTYPDPGETRSPDLSLPKAVDGPADVIAYDPAGRVLLTAGRDKIIRVRDASTGENFTGKVLRELKGYTGSIRAMAFRDAKTLVSFGEDQAVRTWDINSGAYQYSKDLIIAPDQIAFCPGAQPILAEAEGNQVKIWNYETGKLVQTLAPQDTRVVGLAFGGAGDRLITATETAAVRLWDWKKGEVLYPLDGFAAASCAAASATHFALGRPDGTAIIWQLDMKAPHIMLRDNTSAIAAMAFSPKSDQVAAACADGSTRVWDTASGTLLCTQAGGPSPAVAVAFNSNGQKMVSGHADGSVNYWTVPLPPIPAADLEKIKSALPAKAAATPKKAHKILVFWRADAILHKQGVPAGNKAIELMGQKTGAYTADFTRDYAALTPEVLSQYDAIVLNSTAHLAIPESAKQPLLDYVKSGHGVIGIHAAIDNFGHWPEGASIIGGHTIEPFENPAVLQFDLDGIQYALGDLDADDTPNPPKN